MNIFGKGGQCSTDLGIQCYYCSFPFMTITNAYNQLQIMNEGSERTTFQSSRGASNIDLTIVNNHMLAAIEDWEILEEESCSDHNIIKYKLHFKPNRAHAYNFQGPRFIAREHQFADFHNNLRRQI